MSERNAANYLDGVAATAAEHGVPGISLAYSVGDGPVEVAVWGSASPAQGTAVTPETLFQGGSLTKVVTAYAALRLVAVGRLDLDADVNSMLTTWQLPALWVWQPAVTMRMLLAHVAGVSTAWGDGYARDEAVPALVDELAGRTGGPAVQLEALPGLSWFYSSGGYQVAAQVICDVTGLTFAEAVDELVFRPLGMASSTVRQPLPADRVDRAASGHTGAGPLPEGWRNSGGAGASGLWTTPGDLIRLARAINAGMAPAMLSGHPVEPRMGLGVMLTKQDDVTWWSHGGAVPGYECQLAGTGVDGLAVAVMTNAGGAHGLGENIISRVGQDHGGVRGRVELVNLFDAVIDTVIAISAGQEEAVGEYRLPNGTLVEVTAPMGEHGPELHLVLPDQPPVRLWPGAVHRWWVAGLGGTEVVLDPPDVLSIRQFGRQLRALRVG